MYIGVKTLSEEEQSLLKHLYFEPSILLMVMRSVTAATYNDALIGHTMRKAIFST